MPRIAEIPEGATIVRSYEQLEKYLKGFAQGHYPFLWVQGKPGLSKSESIKKAVKGTDAVILSGGQLSPMFFYAECFRHKNKPLILDDAEHVAQYTVGAKLLSALGEHRPVKDLIYGTSNTWLKSNDIPASFSTTSRLCIIANYPTKHVALQSRARLIYFRPSPVEVHNLAGSWVKDKEVYEFIGSILDRIDPAKMDMRKLYNDPIADKKAGVNWKENILNAFCYDEVVLKVLELCKDKTLTPRQRLEKFVKETGQCKATFYNLRKELIEEGSLTETDERGKHRGNGGL